MIFYWLSDNTVAVKWYWIGDELVEWLSLGSLSGIRLAQLWHSIGSGLAEWIYIGWGLALEVFFYWVSGIWLAVQWRCIGKPSGYPLAIWGTPHWGSDSKVASDWQSSGIRMVRWHILVEWQSSDSAVASDWQLNVLLIEESFWLKWQHGGVQVAMKWWKFVLDWHHPTSCWHRSQSQTSHLMPGR